MLTSQSRGLVALEAATSTVKFWGGVFICGHTWIHVHSHRKSLCLRDYLKPESLVFSLYCSQLALLVSELLLCFLIGAPQTFHIVSRAHSLLTVVQKGFLQRELILASEDFL